ncbi:hypothetical protein T492DRAFT_991656 [Pavlovales sp. CCMP2436]|nr:hypothetical protein T492DRAFT_991656 [Pavlovales sp. CCMP2436]
MLKLLVFASACASSRGFVVPNGGRWGLVSGMRLPAGRPAPFREVTIAAEKDEGAEGESVEPYLDATTSAGVAAMLERTFVLTCTELATGYVSTLRLFIAAATAGYERGFTIPALQLELSLTPALTAGRPLMQEEVDLRTLWVVLVYMALQQAYHPCAAAAVVGESLPADIRAKFNTFVYDVVNAKRGGWTLQTLKLEDLMRRSASGGEGGGEGGNGDAPPMTAMEKAVLSQSMRVVFLTLQGLDDVNKASGKSIPGPSFQ